MLARVTPSRDTTCGPYFVRPSWSARYCTKPIPTMAHRRLGTSRRIGPVPFAGPADRHGPRRPRISDVPVRGCYPSEDNYCIIIGFMCIYNHSNTVFRMMRTGTVRILRPARVDGATLGRTVPVRGLGPARRARRRHLRTYESEAAKRPAGVLFSPPIQPRTEYRPPHHMVKTRTYQSEAWDVLTLYPSNLLFNDLLDTYDAGRYCPAAPTLGGISST